MQLERSAEAVAFLVRLFEAGLARAMTISQTRVIVWMALRGCFGAEARYPLDWDRQLARECGIAQRTACEALQRLRECDIVEQYARGRYGIPLDWRDRIPGPPPPTEEE